MHVDTTAGCLLECSEVAAMGEVEGSSFLHRGKTTFSQTIVRIQLSRKTPSQRPTAKVFSNFCLTHTPFSKILSYPLFGTYQRSTLTLVKRSFTDIDDFTRELHQPLRTNVSTFVVNEVFILFSWDRSLTTKWAIAIVGSEPSLSICKLAWMRDTFRNYRTE